jgi:hypothetical protein
MKTIESNKIEGISVQGEHDIILTVRPYMGIDGKTPQRTTIFGDSSVRHVDGELQIARKAKGRGWTELSDRVVPKVSHCTVVLGKQDEHLKDGYIDVEGCTNVSTKLGGLMLNQLRIDRQSTVDRNSRVAQMVILEEVQADEVVIHLDRGSLMAKDLTTKSGLLVAHAARLNLDMVQGLEVDITAATCPGPECYDNLFEPIA